MFFILTLVYFFPFFQNVWGRKNKELRIHKKQYIRNGMVFTLCSISSAPFSLLFLLNCFLVSSLPSALGSILYQIATHCARISMDFEYLQKKLSTLYQNVLSAQNFIIFRLRTSTRTVISILDIVIVINLYFSGVFCGIRRMDLWKEMNRLLKEV